MAQGKGFKKMIGIGEQTDFAVKAVSIDKYLEFLDESVVKEQAEMLSGGITGSAGYKRRVLGAISTNGGIEFEVFPEGAIGTFLKHSLGAVNTETPDFSDNPTVKQHTFTLTDSLPEHGLTFRIDRDIAVKDYFGCKINVLEITAAVNDFLKGKIDILGKNESVGSSMSPSYPTQNPFTFVQGAFTIDGGASVEVGNFTISINNNLREDRHGIISDATRQQIERKSRRDVTGSFTRIYENDTIYDDFISGTPGLLVLKFEGAVISGAYKYTMEIQTPIAYYNSFTPGIGGAEMADSTIPFRAIEKIVAPTAKEIKIILTNTDLSY